jgi:CHASE2 domain-containing sensor protein
MKKIGMYLDYFVTGMGFGAISYLCLLTFIYPGVTPTTKGVVSIFIISGLIGILSMIFKTDLPITIAIIIHLFGTFIAFVAMAMINHWGIGLSSITIFFSIYLIVWLILIGEQKRIIKQLNARIKAKKRT